LQNDFNNDNRLVRESEYLQQSVLTDPDAFAELYRRYLPQVYRYHLAKSGDETSAEDLTAQTFVAALESLNSFRGDGSFLAWLMGIARHKAAAHFRSIRPTLAWEEVDNFTDPAPSPELIVSAHLNRRVLLKALNRLSPDRAEAIYLCVIADLTSREAAEVLGKTSAAVKMLVFRGLRDLRNLLTLNSMEVEE